MIRCAAIVTLFLCFSTSYGQRIPVDKQKHFAAGFILGGVYSVNREVKRPVLSSIAVTTAAAVAKEVYDTRIGGRADLKDIYATVAGGAVSGALCYLLKYKQNKTIYETINFHFSNSGFLCFHSSMRRRGHNRSSAKTAGL